MENSVLLCRTELLSNLRLTPMEEKINQLSLEKIWKAVLSELEIIVSRGSFNTFFAPAKLLEINNQVVKIGCANSYFCDLTEKRYYSLIKDVLDRVTKQNNSLIFSPLPREEKNTIREFGPLFSETLNKNDDLNLFKRKANLRPDFTFENFCVSSSNEMAYAAVTAVARSPGNTYNPLFLYGGVGVGKTHLMQAVGHKLLEKDPKTKVVYCVGEDFTNEIIEAIRGKTTKFFREKFRRAQVLLIDDIQFIAGKEKVQEEFFHTFNAIFREGGQVVLTSDKEPAEINGLEARLRSRFEGGLAIDISPPDFELRAAILLTKAKQRNINLPMEVAKLIAANVDSTRKLEGVLIKIQAVAMVKKQLISLELARLVLGKTDENKEIKRKSVSPKEVLIHLCDFYSLKQTDIKSPCRNRPIALPRQVLMYFLRVELQLPLVEIGNFLGGRDHTTIMHGVEKITNLLSSSERLREEIAALKKNIYG